MIHEYIFILKGWIIKRVYCTRPAGSALINFITFFFIQWDAASSNICAFQCTLFMCVFRVSLVFKTFSQMLQTRPGWVMCWASTCFEMSFLSLENFPQSRHVHISLPSVGFFTFVMCSAIRLSRCANPLMCHPFKRTVTQGVRMPVPFQDVLKEGRAGEDDVVYLNMFILAS